MKVNVNHALMSQKDLDFAHVVIIQLNPLSARKEKCVQIQFPNVITYVIDFFHVEFTSVKRPVIRDLVKLAMNRSIKNADVKKTRGRFPAMLSTIHKS